MNSKMRKTQSLKKGESLHIVDLPVKIQDWNKPGPKSLGMGIEDVSRRFNIIEGEDRREIGSVVGCIGGGITVTVKEGDTNIQALIDFADIWNAVLQTIKRDDLTYEKK